MTLDVEELWCVALGPGLQLISIKMIFRGTVDSCPCHPRDIFRFACLQNASQIIIAHNHPSGDPQPSQEDLELTSRLSTIGEAMEIPVIDHIILTTHNFTSIKELNRTMKALSQPKFKTSTKIDSAEKCYY